MKRQELSIIDRLILDDLQEHPGSTQGQVVQRIMQHGYRSRTYIRDTIIRLVAQGRISDDRSGRAAALSIK